jgi:formylglycine-generating enzyme required for sulfatase activity
MFLGLCSVTGYLYLKNNKELIMGRCQEGMVFVEGGKYKGQTIPDLCVDQYEFTNADAISIAVRTVGSYQLMSVGLNGNTVEVVGSGKDPDALWKTFTARAPDLTRGVAGYFLRPVSTLPISTWPKNFDRLDQPMVNVNGKQAQEICEAQGKRLLTPLEWEYVASPREVCEVSGPYVEFGDEKICDMNGNVWEWTYDPSGDFFISGGSWDSFSSWYLRADGRLGYYPNGSFNVVGFRCGSPA